MTVSEGSAFADEHRRRRQTGAMGKPHEPPVGDIHSGYWELAKDVCTVLLTALTVRRINTLPAHVQNCGEIWYSSGLRSESERTYNAHKIAERLRDHKLMTAFRHTTIRKWLSP